jgi:hypothetical protein
MSKEKFERNKPHVNVGTIGQRSVLKPVVVSSRHTIRLITRRKNVNAVLRLQRLMLSMSQMRVITHTLIARGTRIM